ncbi:hypothetical protein ACFL59_05765, partial [Planctomycetota bacterium]
AVKAGKATEAQAKERWEGYLNRSRGGGLQGTIKKLGVDWAGKIPGILKERGLGREQVEQVLEVMPKLIHVLKGGEDKPERLKEFHAYFKKEVALTDEQFELVVGIARRIVHGVKERVGDGDREGGIEGVYDRMGVNKETYDKVVGVLLDGGIKREELEAVLGGMLRVIHAMRSEGKGFKLDPRLREYFEQRLHLTEKEIELVQGLARRLSHGLKDSDRKRTEADADFEAIWARLQAAVKAGKLTREQAEFKMAEIKKAAAEKAGKAEKPKKNRKKGR